MVTVDYNELRNIFSEILIKYGFLEKEADTCAEIFTENTLVGVHSHGVNRFPGFIKSVINGYVLPLAKPTKENAFNALEQWNANFGPGPLNAITMSKRAMELAWEFGIGCVALKNSNHWMRPGYYAWDAADKGFVFICWTNTIPIMPPWGAKESTTGNNPIILGVPREEGNIVLDMALSQFSYGQLANYRRENKELPFNGGYNQNGKLTKNAKDILDTHRPLPIGYWKGSGLSLLLDLIATILSGGNSTYKIRKKEIDSGMSQIYIAIDPQKFASKEIIDKAIDEIMQFYLSAEKVGEEEISYPGERIIKAKKEHLKNGIQVDENIWEKVLKLKKEV